MSPKVQIDNDFRKISALPTQWTAFERNKGRLGDGCPISIGRVFGTESDNDDERKTHTHAHTHTHTHTYSWRETHTCIHKERVRERESALSTKNERPNR